MISNIDDLKKLSKNDMVSYLYVRDIIRDPNYIDQIQDTNNIFSYNTIIYIILLIIIIILVILLLKKNK
jgi:hypothetical protein